MAKGYRMANNEINNKYGKLLVIERDDNGDDRTSRWKCRCDCGNVVIVRGTALRYGNTRSCGCLSKLPSGIASFNALFANLARGAKRRNIEWTLSKEEVKHITSQNCFYCGAIPSQIYTLPTYNGPYIYNGIDRVDNTAGYTAENSVPCCWWCNKAKGNKTLDEFRDWISNIYIHWASK